MSRTKRLPLVAVTGLILVAPGCVRRSAPGAATEPSPEAAPAGGNLVRNADFSTGSTLPWTSSFSNPASGMLTERDGAACLRIDVAGVNKWDAQIRHREMVVLQGHRYEISFRIWADQPTRAGVKVGMSGPPYGEYFSRLVQVTPQPQTVRAGFVMQAPDDPTVEFAFHLGGNMLAGATLPATVCIDDVFLSDPEFQPPPPAVARAVPLIRVNQIGYFPQASKLAGYVSADREPKTWELLGAGKVVASGTTKPLGPDRDSGDQVHLIDFSPYREAGSGYVLRVGEDESYPFDISVSLYSDMKYAALKYFYHNRSGIEIKLPHAGQERWARPAGHARSDKQVPCAPDAGCNYQLDVSKGWYDAGDHGKYVVNGGISVWTLQNQYEWLSAHGVVAPFLDGMLDIPESGNGAPDILDEARWEMEFLLGMQVPEGQPRAGMVHHKMHDTAWTGLGLAPHEAEAQQKRHLRPVSTAATLNLAATAAQAARLYKSIDPGFSKRCLQAAQRAFEAAKENPVILAPASDGASGGGPYDDLHVEDDFYWALAELYITTKRPALLQELKASPFWKSLSADSGGLPTVMTWARTDGLGTISLATAPGALSGADLEIQRKQLIAAADAFLAVAEEQAYRVPFSSGSDGKYPWGSNSFVLNNMMILAYARELSGEDKYLDGVIWGMDYLLGRNALGRSYVTGFGDVPLENPHHRFWAKQANASYPEAPPGAISGGPNSSLQDPYAQAVGLSGCPPQKCFVDHIEAWSVNEITINWNAPFAWVLAYLDEFGPRAGRQE